MMTNITTISFSKIISLLSFFFCWSWTCFFWLQLIKDSPVCVKDQYLVTEIVLDHQWASARPYIATAMTTKFIPVSWQYFSDAWTKDTEISRIAVPLTAYLPEISVSFSDVLLRYCLKLLSQMCVIFWLSICFTEIIKDEDKILLRSQHFNTLLSSDTIWWHRSGSTLPQVMACCLVATSHNLNQCWLIIGEDQWQLPDYNFTRDISVINHNH